MYWGPGAKREEGIFLKRPTQTSKARTPPGLIQTGRGPTFIVRGGVFGNVLVRVETLSGYASTNYGWAAFSNARTKDIIHTRTSASLLKATALSVHQLLQARRELKEGKALPTSTLTPSTFTGCPWHAGEQKLPPSKGNPTLYLPSKTSAN